MTLLTTPILSTPVTRRGILFGAAGLAAGGLLTACGASPDTSRDPNTVEFVTGNFPPYIAAISTQLGKDFTARSGITVKVTETPNGPGIEQRIQSDLAAGVSNDLVALPFSRLDEFVRAGRAVPIDALMTETNFPTDQIYPSMLKMGQRDNKTYGIPWAPTFVSMFYNADAFRKAGLDPDRPPTTFSELRACAEALVRAKATRYGATFTNDNAYNFLFEGFLFSNHGTMLADDGKTPQFNQAPGVEVLNFWAELFGAGLGQTMAQSEIVQAFGRGDLGIALIHSGQALALTNAASFDVRAAVVPIPDGGTPQAPVGGAVLVVLAKDRARQRAALQVITELVSPNGITGLVKQSGITPVNQVAATQPQYLKTYLEQNPLFSIGSKQIDAAVNWFSFPGRNSAEIAEELNQQMILALRGSKSAADALDAAAKQASLLLENS